MNREKEAPALVEQRAGRGCLSDATGTPRVPQAPRVSQPAQRAFNWSVWLVRTQGGSEQQIELYGDDTTALVMISTAGRLGLSPPGQKWTHRLAGLAEAGVAIEAEETPGGLCYRLACVVERVEENHAEA